MVQQKVIYEQGCKLMVCTPPSNIQEIVIISLNRMQVRMCSTLDSRCLTQRYDSNLGHPQ